MKRNEIKKCKYCDGQIATIGRKAHEETRFHKLFATYPSEGNI